MREAQKNKQHATLLQLAEKAGVGKQAIEPLKADLSGGNRTVGKLRKDGTWPKKEVKKTSDEFLKPPTKGSLRTKPPAHLNRIQPTTIGGPDVQTPGRNESSDH